MYLKISKEVTRVRSASFVASPAIRGVMWMVLAQVFFSAMGVFTRLGAQNVPWQEAALSRFAIGSLVAYLMAVTRGASLCITNKKLMWTRSIAGTLSALSIFYVLASPKIPLGDATTLSSVGPVFVVLLSWPVLGERVGKLVWLSVPFAFAGILLVLKPSFHIAYTLAAIAIIGSFFYSIAMITLRRIGPRESGEAVVLYFSLFGTFVMLCITIPVWVTPDAVTGLFLVFTGLSGGLGQMTMTRAFSLDGAARISALNYLGIIFTYIIAIPVFGDLPTTWQVIGTALVILSGLIITLSAQRESIFPQEP
ncbi:MAG: DMT family transporter [Syntrophobacter sp.]